MEYIDNAIFVLILAGAIYFFSKNVGRIRRNILLGKDIDRSDNSSQRWKVMVKVALGQTKMVVRPVAGIMHLLIYLGFIIINIEMLEIVIDGIAGTHRVFEPMLGGLYPVLINSFEVLAVGVLLSCVVFLARRNVLRIKRFFSAEMTAWPRSDANYILIIEILLMLAFLFMNAADHKAGDFVISQHLKGLLPTDTGTLEIIETAAWWFHIIGVLFFLNYLPYSKHFHVLLAFPTTYYSNLQPKGEFTNMDSVKKEVEMMFDPNADPYAAPPADAEPGRFGAKDVTDLNWKQLMDSYSCTECGRCTSECPANQTGKLLSPRKIMMDTRDRLEQVGKNIDQHGKDHDDGKSLLGDHITKEELWACTSCNACTEACPVNLDPLSIIVDLRRYLVMEESAAPTELNGMFSNIENNGAPWQFAQADRLNWATEN